MFASHNNKEERISSGLKELDEILCGGLIPNRAYLLQGSPGTGKTTLGLYFLAISQKIKEKALFITFEEKESVLRKTAKNINIDLSNVEFLDLTPESEYFIKAQSYDIFSPAEVEREPIIKKIIESIKKLRPKRVFLDPITQFRYLSSDTFQYRKNILSFIRFLIEQHATVLFSSEASLSFPDDDLQFISDGIIKLTFNQYGRFLSVLKFRGSDFIKGYHSFKITKDGLKIFPKLVPKEHIKKARYEKLSFGILDLDKITGGGLESGTITFLIGNSGTGKTTLALQFAKENASKGYRAILYTFDEKIEIIRERAKLVNIELDVLIKNNMLVIEKVDPLQYTPDEFASLIRNEVENNETKIVIIDSISGYKLSMQSENLESHLKALTSYLGNMNVACLAIIELANITGDFNLTDINISYMADNIIFLRYLEINGELRKAIGVIKKRLSDFEKTLREFSITEKGITIGNPLINLRGILLGVPTWIKEEQK